MDLLCILVSDRIKLFWWKGKGHKFCVRIGREILITYKSYFQLSHFRGTVPIFGSKFPAVPPFLYFVPLFSIVFLCTIVCLLIILAIFLRMSRPKVPLFQIFFPAFGYGQVGMYDLQIMYCTVEIIMKDFSLSFGYDFGHKWPNFFLLCGTCGLVPLQWRCHDDAVAQGCVN